jgi:hypothetical protein
MHDRWFSRVQNHTVFRYVRGRERVDPDEQASKTFPRRIRTIRSIQRMKAAGGARRRKQRVRAVPLIRGRNVAGTFMTDPQSTDPGWDVFFSYDREDADQARRIAGALAQRRLRVWIDSDEILGAERWAEEIETGLRSSRVYAMMVTRRALASRWVMDEYYAALAIGNTGGRPRIVPLVAEDVRLPVFLSIRQWVDFRADDGFEAALQKLEKCIREGEASPEADANAAVKRDAQASDASGAAIGRAEMGFLDRALARERGTVPKMWLIRGLALALGVLLSVVLLEMGAPGEVWTAVAVTLCVGLVGWAATERRIVAAAARENRLLFLRDKLEECGARRDASCGRLEAEFWRLMHGDAGAADRRVNDAT